MSELKAHRFITTDELFPEANLGSLYYIKDEADKVIEAKDKEIEELKCQVNGLKNRSNLWHYNAVEEHKKFVQVDLEITELKKKHKTEIKELLCLIRDKENNFNRAFDSEEKRYQKCKRCIAYADSWRSFATFCGMQSTCHNHRGFGNTAENWSRREIHAWKCVKRWLAIADKFKPNSTINRKEASNAM